MRAEQPRRRRGALRRTTRAFVSFRSPAPPTSIFTVPFGPRLVFITSCSPFAALMFCKAKVVPQLSLRHRRRSQATRTMNSAAPRPINSALAFRVLIAILQDA